MSHSPSGAKSDDLDAYVIAEAHYERICAVFVPGTDRLS